MQVPTDNNDTMNWGEISGGNDTSPPERNYALEAEELRDHVQRLQHDLNQATQERQSYAALSQQVLALTQIVEEHRRLMSAPIPGGTVPPATSASGRIQEPVRYEKPRLPDVEVFEKGSHEDYSQWKARVQAKLFADQRAYPTESDQVHYVITRTKGWAFTALRTYVTAMIEGRSTPTLQDLWQQLDGFFVDPTIREKAMQFLRTTKQGNGELIPHVQSFDLKFLEAGLDSASDAQKIDYLKNSLNKRLLRYQVGYQPLTQETYEQFVQRMRFTWENLKAVDWTPSTFVPRTGSPPKTSHHHEPMDWTPTVGAIRPRATREYWGSKAQIQERREKGTCLRCGRSGHRVANCQAQLRMTPPRTKEEKGLIRAAPLSPALDTDLEESGKDEP